MKRAVTSATSLPPSSTCTRPPSSAAARWLEGSYSKELVELVFRQPYCKIAFPVEAGIAQRKTASEYLQELERIGILAGEKRGREVIYKHPALIEVLTK